MTKQEIGRRVMTNLLEQEHDSLPGLIYSTHATPHGILIRTAAHKLRSLSLYLRNTARLQFKSLVDIAVVDKLLSGGRFTVNYLFLSMITNQRIVVQLFTSEVLTIPSLTAPFLNGKRLFAGAA